MGKASAFRLANRREILDSSSASGEKKNLYDHFTSTVHGRLAGVKEELRQRNNLLPLFSHHLHLGIESKQRDGCVCAGLTTHNIAATVPRFRIWGDPSCEAPSLNARAFSLSRGDWTTWVCVTRAPILMTPSSNFNFTNPGYG